MNRRTFFGPVSVVALNPRQEHLPIASGVVSIVANCEPEVPRLAQVNDRVLNLCHSRNFIRIGSLDPRLEPEYRMKSPPRDLLSVQREEQGDRDRPEGTYRERDDPEKVAATLVKLVQERIPERFRLDPIRDVQVLCPMNRGSLGVRELNTALQKVLNPARPGQPAVERFGWRFQIGDKIIQTENDYDKDVFNGDVGIVERVDMVEQQVAVRFDERLVKYDFGELDEISLAYAITIHKSQGAEFPAAVIPLATQHYMLLQRNLIYTGITRGKRLLVLVGQKKALGIAVRNDRPQRRYSGLLGSLRGERQSNCS
jgi:exodeoxyribonuclease V alpha subunit